MQNISVAVIGSGPAGYTAGIYLGRALLKPVLFSGLSVGGQLMFTRNVENFPGFPDGVPGPQFILDLQKQVAKFGADLHHEQITAVDFSQRPFRLWTSLPENVSYEDIKNMSTEELSQAMELIKNNKEADYAAEAVLISTGAEHLKLAVPGEKEYMGKGVGFCAVCDGAFYRDKRVFVVGGGDSALGDALVLTKFSDQVFLVHRRDKFRACKTLQERVLNDNKIKVLWNTELKEILGDGQRVTGLKLLQEGKETELSADGVFMAVGYQPNSAIFVNQIKTNEQGYITTKQFGNAQALLELNKEENSAAENYFPTMTSVPGVFAAGDVTDSLYRQAVVAAGSGAMAAIDIERWLEMSDQA